MRGDYVILGGRLVRSLVRSVAMGLLAGEVTRVLYDFRRKVGTFTGAADCNAVIRE